MGFFTVALFLISTFGLGFTISSFVRNSDNFLERNLMRIGYGLALFPLLGIVLNIFKIPADWRIIFAISIVYPLYVFIRKFSQNKSSILNFSNFRITKSDINTSVMLIIFIASFYIYGTGAFNYPYLEDDDPWGHAETTKYLSIDKNAFGQGAQYARYTNPYPPTYNMMMGILHQTNNSVFWTLKFFNALIISMSFIFFYFFTKEFSGNRNKALFATFALASVPAFMSHFIWAISLTVPLIFVTFYALERINHDKKWWIISGIVMFTTLTSSPTHSAYFALLFVLYIIGKTILERKISFYPFLGGVLGASLSFLIWWLPMFLRYGFSETLKKLGIGVGTGNSALSIAGTADRVYSFKDFFFAQEQNMINNPIGIGVVLSILTLVGLFYIILRLKYLSKKENHWLVISFIWFLFTFYAVNAAQMPIKLSPFRAWMLLVIPLCIIAAEGVFFISKFAEKSGKIVKYGFLALIILGVLFTSTQQKIAVNTAVWPPGAFWTSGEEIQAYLWMKENIGPNANVFGFTINGPIIGMDQFICFWCEDIREFKRSGAHTPAESIHSFLLEKDYNYLIISGNFAKQYGDNFTNFKLQELANSGLFSIEYQNQGAVIFKV
jgi:hypothetical protein